MIKFLVQHLSKFWGGPTVEYASGATDHWNGHAGSQGLSQVCFLCLQLSLVPIPLPSLFFWQLPKSDLQFAFFVIFFLFFELRIQEACAALNWCADSSCCQVSLFLGFMLLPCILIFLSRISKVSSKLLARLQNVNLPELPVLMLGMATGNNDAWKFCK